MRYLFYTVDVFTDSIFGGNQLAVFPHSRGLNSQQMQSIAREFNFSETVFVFEDSRLDIAKNLRIFTPTKEIPFAGHPTIGTAYLLAAIGEIPLNRAVKIINFQEGIGKISVKIQSKKNLPNYIELTATKLAEFGPKPPSISELSAMLCLNIEDIMNDSINYPEAISCGLPFLFIPLVDRTAVAAARLNLNIWEQLLKPFWASSVYIFSYDPELKGSDLRSRMFAPGFGVAEDPATGSAATALAAYLGVRSPQSDGTLKWQIEQGFEMGRPSLLQAIACKQNGKITATGVGGTAVLVSEGTMEVPTIEN